MTVDLVSLTMIMLVAALCPIITQMIPGKIVPQTVLLLLAGALLGPHMFQVIDVDAAIELLSELGLAFLFLLAGYEIDPKQRAGHQGKVGLATWLVTLALAAAIVLLVPYFSQHDMNGAAAIITLTTTALGTLMPILKERELEGTPVGNAVIAYGTWGELGPVLAMAVLLSVRSHVATFIVLGIFGAICVLAAVLPVRAKQRGHKIFSFLTANANNSSQTMMRVTVLLLVALVALSELFDLDAVMGAFAAGFILRYVIPEGMQSLEMKLDGIAYGFLVPVFFVVSGAAIDVRAVAAKPGLLVTFIIMLLLIRAVPIIIAMTLDRKANPMSSHHRVTVALYCTTALPIIVAVTTVAVNAGTMQQSTASTLVAAGAITVFVMPLLGSITYRIADVQPVETVKEIAQTPRDWRAILLDQWHLRQLLRQEVDEETIKRVLLRAGHRSHRNLSPEEEEKLVQAVIARIREERAKRFNELGLEPDSDDALPKHYQYPGD